MAEEKEVNPFKEIDEKAKALGAVHVIRIQEDGKTFSLYLKKPHRDIVGLYYGMKPNNPIKAAEILLKASRVDSLSDSEVIENDNYFYSAYLQVEDYLDVIKLKKSLSLSL